MYPYIYTQTHTMQAHNYQMQTLFLFNILLLFVNEYHNIVEGYKQMLRTYFEAFEKLKSVIF